MFYYAGHGLMDNITYAVCNPDKDQKKKFIKYPLESRLKDLASHKGTYVCSIFDCCREHID